jgi:hypothetical protein
MLPQSILLLAAIAVLINQATYNCTPPVIHHEQAGSNLGCRPAAGHGREGVGWASTIPKPCQKKNITVVMLLTVNLGEVFVSLLLVITVT